MIGREVIRGKVARIDWEWYPAATIEGFTMAVGTDGQWHVRANLVSSNAFNMSRGQEAGRLMFIATVKLREKKREWRWPVERIDTGSALGPREIVATLGEPFP